MDEYLKQQVAMLRRQLDNEGTDYQWVLEDYEGDYASQSFILRGLLEA